jgi:UMF1 family MFS transporter
MSADKHIKSDPVVIRGWVFYDWANSVYPLIISSAIFPIMFEKLTSEKDPSTGKTIYDTVSFFGFECKNTVLYAFLVSISYLVVAFISPLLAGMADYSGKKKRFLQVFCVMGAVFTSLLFFFQPTGAGQKVPVELGISIMPLFFASIGYWGSLVYYNSYLPEIAPPEEHNAISARGFSMGYLGSSLLLILILVLTQFTGLMPIRYAFPLVGAWWLGFAMLTFYRLPNAKISHEHSLTDDKGPKGKLLKQGFSELKQVWNDLKQRVALKRYLAAYFMFNMAVQTVMIMATAFANKEIVGIKTQDLIISILIIQFIGILGSYIFSGLANRYGNLMGLGIAIVVWILLCVYVYVFVYVPWQFYIAAAIVGLVMGGIQSLARATYSKMLPETDDHASYFSFFDVSEKIGLALGTFTFGIIESFADIRTSVLALVVFFVLGLLLLFRVPRSSQS